MLHPLNTNRFVDLADHMNHVLGLIAKYFQKDSYWLGKKVKIPSNTRYSGTVTQVFKHGIIVKTLQNTQHYIPFGKETIIIEVQND